MQVDTTSELIEVLFTPDERHKAMQLVDRQLSIIYLTNTRVSIMKKLAEQEFTDPTKDGENQRIRAYWKGQYDILGELINGALNPDPVPITGEGSPSFSFNPSPEA